MTSTTSTIEWISKEYYTGQRVMDTCLRAAPSLDMIPKDTKFAGKYMPLPVGYGGPQGVGTTVSGAQTAETNTVGKDFMLTVGDLFGVLRMGNKAILQSRNDPGAFIKHKTQEGDGILETIGRTHSSHLFGDGGGSLGRRASISTNTITLSNPEDVVNFEVGMLLGASSATGAAAADAPRAGSSAVTAINREAGTVTVASAAAITSFADNDYLFRADVFAGNVSQSLIWKGFAAWCPSAAPSGGDSFFGVDRSSDTRLSGYREGTTTGHLETRIDKMFTNGNQYYDAQYDLCIVNPSRWRDLRAELAGQGIRPIDVKNTTGTFGYKALAYVTSYGECAITADRYCQPTIGWALDRRHAKIWSMEDLVHVDKTDGNDAQRLSTSAGIEVRFQSYAQFALDKTTALARVSLA